MKKYKEK